MSKIRSAAALMIGGVLLRAARKRMSTGRGTMGGDGSPAAGPSAYATPELRTLFEEWLQKIEDHIVEVVETRPDMSEEAIARELGISKESVLFLINKAVEKGKIPAYAGVVK
jgi:hypothetical protein